MKVYLHISLLRNIYFSMLWTNNSDWIFYNLGFKYRRHYQDWITNRLRGNIKQVHIIFNLILNLPETKDYSIPITHIYVKSKYGKIRKLWQAQKGRIITCRRTHNDKFCHPLCFEEDSASSYKGTNVKM